LDPPEPPDPPLEADMEVGAALLADDDMDPLMDEDMEEAELSWATAAPAAKARSATGARENFILDGEGDLRSTKEGRAQRWCCRRGRRGGLREGRLR
jgi:hypothetical protein